MDAPITNTALGASLLKSNNTSWNPKRKFITKIRTNYFVV